MKSSILYIFTRTPLHVGAGASVGAIDQPVQRERHTGFPIIPASSLKGSFADEWPNLDDGKGKSGRVIEVKDEATGTKTIEIADAAWLFGSDTTDLAFAGSLLFSEARLLAFPIRSARGSYAWITCPLMLQRAARDHAIKFDPATLPEPKDSEAIYKEDGPLALDGNRIVLEEYCFTRTGEYPEKLAEELASALADDPILKSITERLVILSNGLASHFATTACEVAQHVRISDETGTAEGTGLFNQENVPADTLFYSVLAATRSRVPKAARGDSPESSHSGKTSEDALKVFNAKIDEKIVFQFGGDASTGLGFCTVGHREPSAKATPATANQ